MSALYPRCIVVGIAVRPVTPVAEQVGLTNLRAA